MAEWASQSNAADSPFPVGNLWPNWVHVAGGGGHGHGVRRVVMVLLLKCSQRGTRGCFQNDCRTLGSPSTIYTIVSKGEVNALL